MLEAAIEAHFVNRIAATLGEPPKDKNWAGDLAAKLQGVSLSAEQIERAADGLVETGNKAFPGFARCLSALRGAATITRMVSASDGKSDYHSRAAKHIAQNGGRVFGLEATGKTASAHDAWRAYFELTGSAPFMAAQCLRGAIITVPTEWPWDFDASAPRSFKDVPVGIDWSEKAAVQFVAAKPISREALSSGWARGLVEFVKRNHRLPDNRERSEIAAVAKSVEEKATYLIRYGRPNERGFAEAIMKRRMDTEDAIRAIITERKEAA